MTPPASRPTIRPTESLHLRRNGNPRGKPSRGDTPLVPRSLVVAADWSWRLLLVGIVAYAAVRVLALLSLVVIPLVAAVLLAALLRPVAELLHRRLPGPLSALLTLLLAVVVLGGLGYLIGVRFTQQLPSLLQQLVGTVHQLRAELAGGGVAQLQLDQIETSVIGWLQRNRSEAVGYLTTGAGYFIEFFTLLVLTLFITFFFLYDGERIWRWLISPLPAREVRRVDAAGRAAWATTTGYVRGTAVIATIHGIVIGLAMFLLGVPLALPLAVLVFLGSFIPFVGALVAGGLAVLVTFGTQGWLVALILLGILIVESQLEVHLLQPLIVGRYVRLHPLAIGLSFAVGTVLAGIVGAIIAVPTAAVINQIWPALRNYPPRSATKPH
ncbi:MAG TPA: AI-2E family transporter [Pseudonocardiaceae bacterium]|nr:AI-2E family transporter [Pseudonocardiaceae bacterium]